jgi:hypothetical protein
MKKELFLLVTLAVFCLAGLAQLSQTRTATYLNNLNNFRQSYGDQHYPKALAQHVAADDGIYASTGKLTAKRDSLGSNSTNSSSSLALQGFGFTIPAAATIQNITIRVKRFKTGGAPVGDLTLSLMQRYNCDAGDPCKYGVHWTYRDTYAGKTYPDTETQYLFSQSGAGNNGGFLHNEAYQWTPELVNHTYFGVRIDSYIPVGRGSVVIYYDLVEVTVEYNNP